MTGAAPDGLSSLRMTTPDPSAADRRARFAVLRASVTVGAVMALYVPYVAAILGERGLDAAEIGLVLSIAAVVQIAAAPAWGQIADTRLGRPLTLAVVAAGAGIAVLALLPGTAGPLTAFLVIVASFFTSAWQALTDAILVTLRGDPSAYARLRVWLSLFFAIGALLAGLVYASLGFSAALVLFPAGTLVLAALALRVPGRGRPVALPGTAGTPLLRRIVDGPAIGTLRSVRPLRWIILSLVLALFSHVAGYSFLTLRIVDLGGPFGVGASAALSALAEVPVMLIAGTVAARFGLRILFVGGILLGVVAALLWASTDEVILLLAGRPIIGSSYACLTVAGVIAIRRLLPREIQATGQSLFQALGFGLAAIVLNAVGGIVVTRLGDTALYLICAGAGLAGAAIAWRVFGPIDAGRPEDAPA